MILSLVEGRQATQENRQACAQNLINAAFDIYQAKPDSVKNARVTCCIVYPYMFSSELCVFANEGYFEEHIKVGYGKFGEISLLQDRSLSKEWGLILP